MLLPDAKERFQREPAQFIEQAIKVFAKTSPANQMPPMKDYNIFDEPLVRFADGDDPIFTEYKTIIATIHLTPREALAKAYNKPPKICRHVLR